MKMQMTEQPNAMDASAQMKVQEQSEQEQSEPKQQIVDVAWTLTSNHAQAG